MAKVIGNVYAVRRNTATTNTRLGDFATKEEAENFMINHYRSTPKRGKINYTIIAEELKELDGVVFRSYTLAMYGGGGSYFKRYYPKDIDELYASQLL